MSSLLVVNAQVFGPDCMTQDDATLGIDRKDWASGSIANHSDGTMLNFTLPSNTFGDCKKITEITFDLSINNVDLSGLPSDCGGTYWLNTYGASTLLFDPASIPTSDELPDGFDDSPNWADLNGSYTILCDNDVEFPFDGEVGMDIIFAVNTNCSEFQNLVIGGFITFDYSICVSGVVGDAGVATASIDPVTDICAGQELNVEETDPNNVDWEWEGPDMNLSGNSVFNIPITTALDFGTYTVTVTDANGCTAESSTVVSQLPAPNVTASVVSGNTEACPGEPVGFNATGPPGSTYAWSGPGGWLMTGAAPFITAYDPSNEGEYIVTITDVDGCTNTDAVSITTATVPTALAGATFLEVCPGQDIELLELGGDGDMWSWSFDSGTFNSDQQNPIITNSTVADLGTYTVEVTDSAGGGCESTSTVTIIAASPPVADADAVNFSVCVGQDIELLEIGGDADSWSWTGPNSFTSADQNPTITSADLINFGTYTVEVTDIGGCTSTDQLIISQADAPIVCFSGTGEVCENECNDQQYTFDIFPSGGDYEMELTFPGTSIPDFTLTNISDGQSIGVCADPFNGVVDFDGSNLILPTSSVTSGTIIFIEIVSLVDLDNPGCLGTSDPSCQLEIEFTTAAEPTIEFDGNELMDGDVLTCITGFDPVIDLTGVTGTWTIDGDVVFLPVDLTAYPPGDHLIAFEPDPNQCAFPVEVTIDAMPCASCAITDPSLSNVDCDPNSSLTDDSDDFITFTLDPQAIFEGATYTVLVSSGTVTPLTGDYGGPTDFVLQPGSAGNGDITITIQDVDDVTCFAEVTLTDPGSCSSSCNITTADIVLLSCGPNSTTSDPTDDIILFELDVDGVNIGTEYSFTTVYGTLTGTYGAISPFQFPAGSAGAGDIELVIQDVDDPTCTTTITLLDPGTCSGACSIDDITPTVIGCDANNTVNDPADDELSFEINPTGTNVTGDYMITSANGVSPTMGTFGSPTTFTTGSIDPAGTVITFMISSVDDPTCTQIFTVTDLGPCSDGCPDPGTCDDTDCTNGVFVWNDQICDCEEIVQVLGCTNTTANNYDPAATCDDGSCDFDCPDPGTCDDTDCTNGVFEWNGNTCECEEVVQVLGCTDPTANNYDPAATCDDGTCDFDCPDPGDCDDTDCTNGVFEWNDVSCECEEIAQVLGCTDPNANNYDPTATCDDGTCDFDCPDPGDCDDTDCTNGVFEWNNVICDCEEVIQVDGCTDPDANNYDPNATCDDGTCDYDCPDPGDCDDTDCTNGVFEWNVDICDCEEVAQVLGCTDPDANNFDPNATCDDGTCDFDCPDPGDCDDADCTNGVFEWNNVSCECEEIAQVLGCTDPSANNYDPDATCDDGSCDFDCPDPGDCDNGICEDGEEVWNDVICDCEPTNVPVPCVDDGDCNNGIEVWDNLLCTCIIENFIDPATCVDDGDCSNGFEIWDDENCECLSEEPLDCLSGGGIEMECDDEDPCTVNDIMTVLECTNEICVPCAGIILDCADASNVTIQPCDDGSDFTENDSETILDCDGSICEPCAGTLMSPTIFFPQIFTPDGDGNNDEWGLFSNQEFLIKELKIYDRWGEVMFSVENIMNTDDSHKWNGRFNNTQVNPGVYVYYVLLGEPFDQVMAGDLTLVY